MWFFFRTYFFFHRGTLTLGTGSTRISTKIINKKDTINDECGFFSGLTFFSQGYADAGDWIRRQEEKAKRLEDGQDEFMEPWNLDMDINVPELRMIFSGIVTVRVCICV